MSLGNRQAGLLFVAARDGVVSTLSLGRHAYETRVARGLRERGLLRRSGGSVVQHDWRITKEGAVALALHFARNLTAADVRSGRF